MAAPAPSPGPAGPPGLTLDSNPASQPTSFSGVLFGTGPDGRPFTTNVPASGPLVASTPTAGNAPAPTSASPFVTTITTTNSPTASPAPSSGPTIQGPILAAIIVPIVAVLALIPLGYIAWLHYRNKRRGRRLSSPDFGDMSAPQPQHDSKLLPHRPSTKLSPVTLPVPFTDSDRIKSGALGVYEVPPPPPSDTLSGSTVRPPPTGRTPVIYEHYRDQRASGRPSSELEPPHIRAPSPTLPSPPAQPQHWRPSSDAWPLPNGAPLPDPAPPYDSPYDPPYDPHSARTNKPLPVPLGLGASAARHVPLHAARSEALATPTSLHAPGGGARPASSDYEGTPTGPVFPAPLQPRAPPGGGAGRYGDGERRSGRYRNSDLVSEMSYPPDDRSAVSSMTAGRRKSQREADAISEVSDEGVLGPRAL